MDSKKQQDENPLPEFAPEPNRVPRWVMPLIKGGIIFVDGVLAFFCFAAAFSARENATVFLGDTWSWSPEFLPYAAVAAFGVAIRILTLAYSRVYRFTGAFSYVAELIKVFKAVLTGSLFIIAVTFLFRGGFAFREFSYSRGVFVLDFVLALMLFSLFHLLLRFFQSVARRRDINLIPTLIVGTNSEAEQTVKALAEQPELGYRVVGVVGTNTDSRLGWKSINNVVLVGVLKDLPRLIRHLDIQEVIITDSEIPSETLFEAMLESGRQRRVEFRLAPSLFNFMPQKTNVEQIGVLPMVRLFREPLSDVERFLKRISDIAIAAVSLVLLAPVWLVSALAIKFDSPGSILFAQERVGMDGRKFLFYKFRTMRSDADDSLHREAYRKNIEGGDEANSGDDNDPLFGKVRNDPRITRVGDFLRRSSLDEIPQLINVFKGDMSIVGPRPPIPYEVEEYDIRHRKRLDMKPGITGLWQVSGRNRLTFEEMVRIDLYYIENWSLLLDLRIILLTLPAMFRGDETR